MEESDDDERVPVFMAPVVDITTTDAAVRDGSNIGRVPHCEKMTNIDDGASDVSRHDVDDCLSEKFSDVEELSGTSTTHYCQYEVKSIKYEVCLLTSWLHLEYELDDSNDSCSDVETAPSAVDVKDNVDDIVEPPNWWELVPYSFTIRVPYDTRMAVTDVEEIQEEGGNLKKVWRCKKRVWAEPLRDLMKEVNRFCVFQYESHRMGNGTKRHFSAIGYCSHSS